MKVAIVHDWLTSAGGAERVLRELLVLFPDADLFSVVDFMNDDDRKIIFGRRATTSFIQRLPWARGRYRNYLPLMPIAVEQFDLSAYDLIISSSYAVAKGVLVGPDQLHLSYVHSPMRYAWDLQHEYLRESGLDRGIKSLLARFILHYMRIWDFRTSVSADVLIANSGFVRRRIRKVYGRDSVVIHPPVDLDRFSVGVIKEDYYLVASRMVPYKRIPLIAEAFSSMPEKKLVIIGTGPDFEKVKKVSGPNISVMGYQSDEVLVDYMKRAKAFVFAAEEDFGIAPLEAQACGTPVIAFGKGGALETVIANKSEEENTGVFFYEQSAAEIVNAVEKFEASKISSFTCRANADRFSAEQFRFNIRTLIDKCAAEY